MSVEELKSAIMRLPQPELTAFKQWFDEFFADLWDRQIQADIEAGRLDEAGRQADADFNTGSSTAAPPWGNIYDGLNADEVDRLDLAIRQRADLTRDSE
jgi:hypothetical protein